MDPLTLPKDHPLRLMAEDIASRKSSPEWIIEQVEIRVQARLDAFAATRGYDGILSACTYATSDIPKFAAEAQTCVNLRDATWAACYQIMADVQAGRRALPTVEQAMSELPQLEWTP